MLILNRMIHPFEVRTCRMTGEMIVYGDYFYEDDEDGIVIKASEYKKLQKEAKKDAFDYTLLNQAKSEKEYKEIIKKAEQSYLKQSILDRKVCENGVIKDSGLA